MVRLFTQLESLEEVQRQKGGQALGRRRGFIDDATPITDGERLAPLSLVARQVLSRQEPVVLEPPGDGLGDIEPW